MLLLVLVLSIAVLVLVLEVTEYIYPAYWSAISGESPRSTIGIAAVQTAIEYEYRFTEYRPPRRTEYEYDEIRYEARKNPCKSWVPTERNYLNTLFKNHKIDLVVMEVCGPSG